MSLRLNHNIASLNSWRNLLDTDRHLSKSMERLSSGYKINKAADDPAGLAISQKMRTQIAGLEQAVSNSEHAIAMIQTVEGALTEIHNLLIDIRRLAVHAANLAVNDNVMLAADQAQIKEAINTIDRIATSSQFGSNKVLNGYFSGPTGFILSVVYSGDPNIPNTYVSIPTTSPPDSAIFQVGADADQVVSIAIQAATANMLGGGSLYLSNINVMTAVGANDAIRTVSLAGTAISNLRAKLGAFQSYTLEVNLSQLRISTENMTASESTIRDTDMALEVANFTRYQIMLQAGVAMLAQANLIPRTVIRLLE
jgi:flagellin